MLQLAIDNGTIVRGFAVASSPRVQMVDSELSHVRVLAERLRDLDRVEIAAQGLGAYTALRRVFRGSLWARTAIIDGEIGAMFGLGGTVIGDIGMPWLLTAPVIERVPVTFVREAKVMVAAMLEQKPILSNHVLASYRGACRLLDILGFTLDEPAPYGVGNVLFRRFHMERS